MLLDFRISLQKIHLTIHPTANIFYRILHFLMRLLIFFQLVFYNLLKLIHFLFQSTHLVLQVINKIGQGINIPPLLGSHFSYHHLRLP